MRVFAPLARPAALCLCAIFVTAVSGCDDGDRQGRSDSTAASAANDSLSKERAAVIADLQERIVFLLSTSPDRLTASIYGGKGDDSTVTINVANDTNHIAPRVILESPTVTRKLWSVGYRQVSFPDDMSGRSVIVPLSDPNSTSVVSNAPNGVAGEAVRRQFADSAAQRLRAVGADARARGSERDILYLDGLSGSAPVALSYANALSGGMLTIERMRALRFVQIVIAEKDRSWCWDLARGTPPTSCGLPDQSTARP